MKLALCLVFCLGLALARVEEWSWLDEVEPSRTIEDSEFQTGREFHYFYNGQMTTGIPGSSKQHSGTRIQALVTFVFKGSNVCLMKLNNIRMGKMNRDLPNPRKIVPFDSFEEIQIEPKHKDKLQLPIKFTYNGGLITDVVFDGEDQPWSANIKRGIMNLMQVNVQQQKSLDSIDQRLTNVASTNEIEDSVFYRVMEETVEGECETLYTITKQPNMKSYKREVLNVTKSINFEKCKKRPQIKYNFRFSDPCPTCESKYNEDEKFLKSSTVAFYNITGTVRNFMIDSARVESEYTFVPFNEESNVIVTCVNQSLVLIKTSPLSNRVEEPRRQVESDSDMIYTLDWDIAKEKFHMEDDVTFLHKSMVSDLSRKVELVGTLLEKLVGKMRDSVEDDAPKYFERLVALFRLCTKEEIEQIHTAFYRGSRFSEEEQKKIRDILPHAHALSGSKACVQHLVEKIRTNEIPTLTAVLALKELINIRTPSKEIIQELLKLTETDLVERNYALKQTTWLTIGSLMNALCSNDVDQWAREFKETTERMCPRQLKERYVKLLVDKFESTNKWEERLTYLKALGNAGMDVSIFDLEKIIRNRDNRYSTMIRTEAVLAMRQLKNMMPKKIQKVLMPILLNKMEPPTLRIACSYMILQTIPERPILDQLAKLVQNERSLQVASFVHSYMNSLANSSNPCEKKLATEMRLALRHSRYINTSPLGYSKLYRVSAHSTHHKVGLDLDLGSSFSNTSYIPRTLTAVLHSNFLGFWNKYLVTFGFVNEGLESLMRRFYSEQNVFADQSLDEIYSRGPRANLNDYERELRNIFSSMKIRSRDSEESTQEPKALLYMKFKDQDFGFLPIKEEMIRSWLNENNLNMREVESKLRSGVKVNFNKATILHEMSYKIPTTMGLPLSVTIKVPMVLSLHGNLKAVSNSERSLKSFKVAAELKPSMVATMVVDVECWSPIVNHGLKVVNKVKVFQPVDVKVEVDLLTQPKTVKIMVRPPTTHRELVSLESRPITYSRSWTKFLTTLEESDEKTVMGEEMNRIHTFNKCYGRKTFGVEMCLRGQVHKTPAKSISGTPFFPLSGPNKIILTAEPGDQVPEDIVITLTGKLMEPMDSTYRPSMIKDFDTSRSFEDDRDDPFTSRNDRNERNSREEDSTYSPKKHLSNKLKVDVESRSRKFSFDLTHLYDLAGRFGKLQVKLARSPVPEDNEPFMACWESESLFPNAPMVAREIKNDKVLTNARLTWGRTCQSENFITLKSKAIKSRTQTLYESETPEYRTYENCRDKSWCSPISQKEFLNEVSDLLKYQVEIDYNNVPVAVQNYTNKLFTMLKHHYFDQADIAQIMVRNPENKIRATVTIDPITKHHINVTIKTPHENTTIHDISTPVMLTPVNTKQSYFKNLLDTVDDDTMTATCHVSSRKINTFDDVEYSVPLSTCYAILAKDCSSEPSFVVMMRKLTESTELKEIKIISRSHKVVLTPESDSDDRIKVNVNDRDYPLTEDIEMPEGGYPVVRISKEGSQVKVELLSHGVTVYFDGYATNIELSHMYRNKQCGLCGHFDMEPNDEFRTPDLTLTEDVREFYLTYITKGKDCRYPEMNTLCTDASCRYKPYWETTDEIQSSYERLTDDTPIMKRKIVETENEICISLDKVPECPSNTYSKNKVEKRVVYKCLDRNDPKAWEYQNRIRYEQTVFEIEDATPSVTRTEYVPTKCIPFY